jgi:hypothetical protein
MHRVGGLLVFIGLESDPDGTPLPNRRRALRIGGIIAARLAERFVQNRFATSDREHDGEEFLAVVGNAAIDSVVAIPTGHRIIGVEFG